MVEQLDPNLDRASFRLGGLQLGNTTIQLPAEGSFRAILTTRKRWAISSRVGGHRPEQQHAELRHPGHRPDNRRSDPGSALDCLPPAPGSRVHHPPLAGLATGTQISARPGCCSILRRPRTRRRSPNTVDRRHADHDTRRHTRVGRFVEYQVSWNAVGDPGGSGVKSVTVYVAEDGGNYQVWLDQTTATSASTRGKPDTPTNSSRWPPTMRGIRSNRRSAARFLRAIRASISALCRRVAAASPTLGPPAQPSTSQATNPLFVQAKQNVPAPTPLTNPSEFQQVLQPFTAQAFATGIGQSEAGIGPMAILQLANGDCLISGGADRNQLFLFSSTGGAAGTPLATLPYPIYDLALDAAGNVWAATGGGPLLELNAATGASWPNSAKALRRPWPSTRQTG